MIPRLRKNNMSNTICTMFASYYCVIVDCFRWDRCCSSHCCSMCPFIFSLIVLTLHHIIIFVFVFFCFIFIMPILLNNWIMMMHTVGRMTPLLLLLTNLLIKLEKGSLKWSLSNTLCFGDSELFCSESITGALTRSKRLKETKKVQYEGGVMQRLDKRKNE
jgi:hypothetical protein